MLDTKRGVTSGFGSAAQFLTRGAMLLFMAANLFASGPRYVTGPPFFTGRAGVAVGWRQPALMYYTDPGDLNLAINHQAADGIVAAAAGVWNVPVASITIAQGGMLAEHVTGGNVYLDGSGMVYPDDVGSGNAASVPIAVIYDTDGSVTDTLLGGGASDPSGCRQSSVTESVDSFDPAGYILHALIVINGRCTGRAPESQLQLQYDLMRAFGRVLGLAWSQTNDNVFTGTPTPTHNQAEHWPILHPIDILCGLYSYQCLPDPFTLRPDDVSAMVGVYPIAADASVAPGKQPSLEYAHSADGSVSFPDGQGMAGVNVLVRRRPAYSTNTDEWFETSAVTGTTFNREGSSPFAPGVSGGPFSFGTRDLTSLGQYSIAYIPLSDPHNWQSLIASTEAVNPLYIGSYSLGPYTLGNVAPAGSPPTPETAGITGAFGDAPLFFSVADAPTACGQGADGTAAVPAEIAVTGWWNGLLCGYGHASYARAETRPGRSFTIEVTALDEQGQATQDKAMPVIGAFALSDGVNDAPSLGVSASAFQSAEFGTTNLIGQTASSSGVRIGIADERGDGRPDFAYQARFFYADTVTPAAILQSGGRATIQGMGFRAGNAVQVNGFDVPVVSWSATALVVDLPSMAATHAAANVGVDVAVLDRETGASSTMMGALLYESTAGAGSMKILTAQTGTVLVGDAVAIPFAVQVLAADGVTPMVGEEVTFSASGGAQGQAAARMFGQHGTGQRGTGQGGPGQGGTGQRGPGLRAEALTGPAEFTVCAAARCTVQTDSHGVARSGVTPQTVGTITLQATDGPLQQQATLTAIPQTNSMKVLQVPGGELKVGQVADARFIVRDYGPDGYTGLPGRLITFSVPVGGASFGGCSASVCSVVTDASGFAAMTVTPTLAGPLTLRAKDGDVQQDVSLVALDDTDVIEVITVPGEPTYVNENTAHFNIRLVHKDGVSADYYQYVTFTGPPDINFGLCNSNVCQVQTNTDGFAGSVVIARKPGTYAMQVAYGSLVKQATMTVTERTMQLRILSAPSSDVPVGTTSPVAFSAQLIGLDQVTPETEVLIALVGPEDGVIFDACRQAHCYLTPDANGIVSTKVTVVRPGQISLNAVYLNLVTTAQFNAVGQDVTMRIVKQPPTAGLYVQDSATFAVQVFDIDGVTPLAGKIVTFLLTNGVLSFGDCNYASCRVQSDENGIASIQGVPEVGGPISVQATYERATRTMSFAAAERQYAMRLVSAPPNGIFHRGQTAGLFTVQVVGADGVTPAPGQNVTFSVADTAAQFSACTDPVCVVVTDAAGMAQTGVTALRSGAISVTAADNSLVRSETFTLAASADQMQLISTPPGSIVAGSPAATAFSVRVVEADGVSAAAGVPVTFSIVGRGAGTVAFGPCAAALCQAFTDSQGVAFVSVTGLAAGAVTLLATEDLSSGGASVAASIEVRADVYSVTAIEAETYVAEGAAFQLQLDATVTIAGEPVASQAVLWTAVGGFSVSSGQTVTDGQGKIVDGATLLPLAAGAEAVVTACSWTDICARFRATGVSAQQWAIEVVSGGVQTVHQGEALQPLVVQVRDRVGHPIAAAPVTVYQEVTAAGVACPAHGRCPAAPVLATRVTIMQSDGDGLVTVVPLTVAGSANSTRIALSAGTQGLATVVLASGRGE